MGGADALQCHTKSATSYGVWGHAQRSILSALNRYFNENQKQGKQKIVHLEISKNRSKSRNNVSRLIEYSENKLLRCWASFFISS